MAKGIGLIGNFKGKVGNMVGYKLSDSNTGNSQGIRVYQPIVRNPKTSAQAEQRAKLAPINATYRALKMVIDRGNEGLPYGNKSRLAWLKQAFKAEYMPWFEKGAVVVNPVLCGLTKGSLSGVDFGVSEDGLTITCPNVTTETAMATIGNLSTALKADYPLLKDGDQITIVHCGPGASALEGVAFSFLIDTTSTEPITSFSGQPGYIRFEASFANEAFSVIVSREGANGEHLRSTAALLSKETVITDSPYTEAAKEAAIASYMSSAAANSDWAEESIQ